MIEPSDINFGDAEIRAVGFEENDCIVTFLLPESVEYVSLKFLNVGQFWFETNSLQNVIDLEWYDNISDAFKNDEFAKLYNRLREPEKIKLSNMKVLCINCIVGGSGGIIFSDVIVVN